MTAPPSFPSTQGQPSRRTFLGALCWVAAATIARPKLEAAASTSKAMIACNTYPWETFYRRDNRDFSADLDQAATAMEEMGIQNLEPNLEDLAMVDRYSSILAEHGVGMRSIYVNSVLHDATKADASIAHVMQIATRARDRASSEIVVTNPSPIRWGGPEDKSDAEILQQAKALGQLGAALNGEGLTLAYHNHDSELRQGAREFRHMLAATDPLHVKFCLDAHWIFRGCGDSEVAVFDVLAEHADRIVELHLRQSSGGVWNETFAASGDIDYARLIGFLYAKGIQPLLTLEQAVESASPHTLNAVEAHQASVAGLRRLLDGA